MNWKDDLKKALYKAGTENKASVFLLNCSHVKDESFLEDVNMLLKTGDVPNLFGLDEKAEIYEKMQFIIKEQGKKIDTIPSALYDFFINCIHQYLHIILVMSPTEKCFRKYLRTFPSLVRCCTVNWFQVWPDDALETIAKKLLKNVSTEETRESCVQICKYFHKDVSSVSEKYCMQTQRHNYVTSTSYIELILTFKELLAMKQEKLLSFRNRYTVGLERLKFAASQISVMQNEIESLQPQLMGTSQDTEKLMVKIEQDTVKVEAKKEVILSENTDKNFRLWLTSCPCLEFPVSILLNAIKVINEIPTKIKDNLLYSFTNCPLPTSLFSKKSKKFERERKVLFLLCFFNAVVQERKNYVPVGWTIPYEFNDVDMHVSRQFFEGCFDKDNISWKALKCMITECNYGGYIANEIDQQLLSALFSTYCNEETIKQNAVIFTENDIYRFPPMNEINSCIEYIHNFSSDTLPEIVGLHNNALIIKGNQDTKQLFENLKVIQSNVPEEYHTSSMDVATEIANDIINNIPKPFEINQVIEKYPPDYKCAMNVVLIQEIDKYNCLINTMLHSLKDMQKVIMGFFELSDEMEEFIEDIISGKVPVKWVVKSYLFFGSLTSFISGLLKRLNFFTNWIEEGLPKLYSMSAFYFPHSFLIGCLQLYARNNSACIDDLKFHFEVLDEGNEHDRNEDFYIQDLFLEGAQWNCTKKCIMECSPRKFLYKLPIIWFKPVTENAQPVKNVYRCPVYRTRTHHTSLSSSQTNNHILTIDLPSDMPEDDWIKRAVVIVCQLDGSD